MMNIVEFEAKIDEHGNIHVPAEMAAKLGYGKSLRVSIASTELAASDEAWDAILRFVDGRRAEIAGNKPYQWWREDAYYELNEKHSTNSLD